MLIVLVNVNVKHQGLDMSHAAGNLRVFVLCLHPIAVSYKLGAIHAIALHFLQFNFVRNGIIFDSQVGLVCTLVQSVEFVPHKTVFGFEI